MKKDRKQSVLGFFVFGALLLGFFFLLFFGGIDFLHQRQSFILYFDSSVKGLQVGSPVLLRGVKVGQVRDIQLRANPEDKNMQIPVIIELEPSRIIWTQENSKPSKIFEDLIERGLKGQLALQSFVTGSCNVELDFYPDTASETLGKHQTQYPQIPTVPSRLQELTQTVERLPLDDLANKLLSSLEGIEDIVHSPKIPNSLDSLDQTMQSLEQTVRLVQNDLPSIVRGMERTMLDIQELVKNTNQQITQAGSGFSATQLQTKDLLNLISTEAEAVSAEVKKTALSLRHVFKQIQNSFSQNADGFLGQLSSELQMSFSAVRSTLKQTEKTLGALQAATDEDSALRFELTNTLRELSAAARSIRNLTDYLERHPEALLKGKRGY